MNQFKHILVLSSFLFVFGMSACSSEENKDIIEPTEGVQEAPVTAPNEPSEPNEDTQDGNSEEDPNEKKPNSSEKGNETERPLTKQDTINLEGSEEPFAFQLYESTSLGFSTYIVEDMIADTVSSGEGDVFIAKANFGGTVTEEARISIFSPNELDIKSLEDLSQLSKEISEINGFTITERNKDAINHFAWSIDEYDIQMKKQSGEWIIGTVSLFSRGERFYMMTIQYPEDYAEGFYPRVLRLVEEIVWIE